MFARSVAHVVYKEERLFGLVLTQTEKASDKM